MVPEYLTRADLYRQGLTRRAIQVQVRRGALIHVRRDRYLPADAHDFFVRAARVGGRLTCLSLLSLLGVFVLENRHLHVQVDPTASRLRSPHSRKTPISGARKHGVVLHWGRLIGIAGSSCAVDVRDAVIHAVLCQPPRAAIATLDSALQKGIIAAAELTDLFAALPHRFQTLLAFVDGRAESGPETLVRLMARTLGCDVQVQVMFEGIGRVDLLLDGWLVVECDSKEFHADWEAQVKDRERDLALASRGYCSFRVTAATIMYRPDEVLTALRSLIQSRRFA